MRKTAISLLLCSLTVNPAAYAQEAIEIEIDSAPVEVEIPQPPGADEQAPQTAQAPEQKPEKDAAETGGMGKLAIAAGVLVAGALAALAGGGGSSSSGH